MEAGKNRSFYGYLVYMVADFNNMVNLFHKCNMNYFGGELTLPRFELLHSFCICGRFEYSLGWFRNKIKDPLIKITDYYDFTLEQYVDIMVHEMIHYYLVYTGLDKKCTHGKQFQMMARKLNRKYKLHVTPTLDITHYSRRKGTPLISYLWSRIRYTWFFLVTKGYCTRW